MTPEPQPYERLVTISTFSSIAEARIAQSTLESFGIEAELELDTSYSAAIGGAKLLVPGESAIWALHYLQKTAEPLDAAAILTHGGAEDDDDEPCPRCGSDRVYPIENRRKIGAVVLFSVISIPMAIVAMLCAPFRLLLSSHNECKACSHRW